MQFESKITPNVIAKDEVVKQSQNDTQSIFDNLSSLLIRLTYLKNKIKFKDTYYAKKGEENEKKEGSNNCCFSNAAL